MLKATAEVDGVPAVVLGLTARNLELLRQGVPIHFNARDLPGGADYPSIVFVLFFGEDNRALARELRTNPQLTQASDMVIRIVPGTHGVDP